jgi:PAS domain S-box-containing protein
MHGRSDAGVSGLEFLHSGGEMGTLMRAHDWSGSPLGAPETWPQSLRSVVGLILGSKFPMFVAWGPELGFLYNDAYAEILGAKHPTALGARFRDIWSEIWPDISPLADAALAGEATYRENLPLLVHRKGFDEQAWFTFSYSPVRDEAGRIAGMYCAVAETTQVVLADRQRAADTARQRRLFEQAPGFITILTGPEHSFEFTNAAYRRLFGDRGYVGKTVREVFPELVDQAFFELLDSVYASGKRFVADHIPIRFERAERGPEERFLDFIYEPVTDEAGRVTGIFVEGHDVTDAHWAEAALRESEARYRTLFDAVDAGFCVVEVLFDDGDQPVDYRFVEANPAFGRQTGLQDAVGRTARELIPDLEPHWFEIYGRVALTGEPVRFENGSDAMGRWFDVYALRVGDPRDRRVAILFNDITERRRAEERLRELNEQLEQHVAARTAERNRVWEMSRDLFAIMGFDGYLKAINPAWETTLGRDRDTLLALSFREQVHPEDHAAVMAVMKQLLRGETVTQFEDRLRHKDGSWRWISWTLVPEGEVFYAVGRDVTAEKERQTELESAQDALRQAQKMEAVGQLTGGVAHDFNNLLTIIKSSTDLLRRPDLAEERRRRYMDAISDTVDRASKLTGQLLAFARRQALKPEVFDVPRRIQALSDMLRTIVGARIRIVNQIACESCLVETDVTQFETALVNMAVNARDAMDGEGTLTIRVESLSGVPAIRGHAGSAGTFVAVSLTDTGVGIAPDALPHIFEPFFTTKEVGKGTGLGLSQVYGFAKQSGGDLDVKSEVGRGATFILYLPRVECEPEDAQVGVRAPIQGDTGGGRRVLVVEDNVEVGTFSTQILQDLGYEPTWAANADEALALLAQGLQIDVVFTDVVMPGRSGVELGHEIRRLYPGLPVILTSGYSHVLAEEGRHGFELLQKPYAVEELSRVLRRVAREGAVDSRRG